MRCRGHERLPAGSGACVCAGPARGRAISRGAGRPQRACCSAAAAPGGLHADLGTARQVQTGAVRLAEGNGAAVQDRPAQQLARESGYDRAGGAGTATPLPSSGWQVLPHHLRAEALWQAIREEAREDAEMEPSLASLLHTTILTHGSLAKSMAFMLANKLSSRTLLGTQLMSLILRAYEDDPGIMDACRADVQAVMERDAACDKFLHCLLYYKGFQAVQCHRIAHWLWQHDRQTLAVAIQSRVSEVMQVDIHPAARIGRGLMIDHATGVVIGETAVVGDNVSLLHHVTLGGSGVGRGKRHPTIGHGVLLGAGTCVLGPISVGAGSKVGAGSVVVTDLPCHCVAVGVPARIVKQNCTHEPCEDMDSVEDFIFDYQI